MASVIPMSNKGENKRLKRVEKREKVSKAKKELIAREKNLRPEYVQAVKDYWAAVGDHERSIESLNSLCAERELLWDGDEDAIEITAECERAHTESCRLAYMLDKLALDAEEIQARYKKIRSRVEKLTGKEIKLKEIEDIEALKRG